MASEKLSPSASSGSLMTNVSGPSNRVRAYAFASPTISNSRIVYSTPFSVSAPAHRPAKLSGPRRLRRPWHYDRRENSSVTGSPSWTACQDPTKAALSACAWASDGMASIPASIRVWARYRIGRDTGMARFPRSALSCASIGRCATPSRREWRRSSASRGGPPASRIKASRHQAGDTPHAHHPRRRRPDGADPQGRQPPGGGRAHAGPAGPGPSTRAAT